MVLIDFKNVSSRQDEKTKQKIIKPKYWTKNSSSINTTIQTVILIFHKSKQPFEIEIIPKLQNIEGGKKIQELTTRLKKSRNLQPSVS